MKFRFLSGGYHAAAWGKHPNDEAAAEWPPSPWRIVRAMAAVWKQSLPDFPESRVLPVIEKLASERPKFHLPRAAVAHTRHYMPLGELTGESGKPKRKENAKLFFDIFVSMGKDAPLYAIWDGVELDAKQSETLTALLTAMPYLGRAESWIEARAVSSAPEPNCAPIESVGDGRRGGEWERILVLAPSILPAPKRLLKNAIAETGAILKSGKPIPEGVERVRYVRKRGILNNETERAGMNPRPERESAATVVRLSMTGETHQPSVVDTLRWGDAARKTAVRMSGGASRILSGIDPRTNKPIADPSHPRAFYLPADEDGDGGLDTLTVWAPGGLSEDDIDALTRMKVLYTRRGERESNPSGLSKPRGRKRFRARFAFVLQIEILGIGHAVHSDPPLAQKGQIQRKEARRLGDAGAARNRKAGKFGNPRKSGSACRGCCCAETDSIPTMVSFTTPRPGRGSRRASTTR